MTEFEFALKVSTVWAVLVIFVAMCVYFIGCNMLSQIKKLQDHADWQAGEMKWRQKRIDELIAQIDRMNTANREARELLEEA